MPQELKDETLRQNILDYLLQNGAPSHVDLFDWKPKLREQHGKQIPDEIAAGKRFSTMTGGQKQRLIDRLGDEDGQIPGRPI